MLFATFAAALPFSVNEEINGEKTTVVFEKPAQRAVSLSQFSTEMLLALGLKERMVGTAFLEEPIAEKVKSDYEKVPVLAEKWPSLEVFLESAPDFAIGWGVAFSKKGVEAQSILSKGVKIFIPKSTIEFSATMDTLMDDFITLGKIFEIEDEAGKYVSREKKRLDAVNGKISNLPEKTVFLYDSGDTEPFTVFEGFTTNLLKMAGAHNILSGKGAQKTWGKANWEDVIAGDPDYFIIVEYDTAIRDQTDWESKINYIKSNPRLQGLKAVKNEAFIRVRLADICPGIRNVDFLESLAEDLHGR
jgi:iron complex transport system substrate-binding protein